MGTSDPNQSGPESCRLRGAFFTPSIFNDFRERGDFFDVNLFTDDGALSAHKVILSACSDFFREKLRKMQPSWTVQNNSVPGTIPVMAAIYMSGVTLADLQSILDFIYTGDVQMSLERLDDFLLTAQRLKVKGLLSEEYFVRETTSETVSGSRSAATRDAPEPKRARLDRRPQRAARSGRSDKERQDEQSQLANVKVEPAPEMLKVVEEVGASMEIVEATGSNEEDDVRFDLGDWRLDIGDDKEENTEVLIDGQKVQKFIKKVDTLYQCQLCDHSSKDKSNLVRHLKRRHTTPTHELCPHCGKTYKNKECLYNHMSSKRCLRVSALNPRDPKILNSLTYDTEDKRWVCVSCGNRYRQKVYAREHVIYKHIGPERSGEDQDMSGMETQELSKYKEFIPSQNKWKCVICNKNFTSEFNVNHHIQQKHQREEDDGEVRDSNEEESDEEGQD